MGNVRTQTDKLRSYDFFAGSGLVSFALRDSWECVWANDIDSGKAEVYRANAGASHFHLGDVLEVNTSDLPGTADLAWASFPCQDLSLAGWQEGLGAGRSGVFWAFWRLMRGLIAEGRRPAVIVVENVPGVLYGDSFHGLCEAFAALGLQFGALVIDAKSFVPQSRQRVFLIGVDAGVDCGDLARPFSDERWTPPALDRAASRLPTEVRRFWRWWHLPTPAEAPPSIADLIEDEPSGVKWHSPEATRRLMDMMDENNLKKVHAAQGAKQRLIGFLYKRIRQGVQRAEIRFDGVAGCLRTPQGGSSRQTVVVVDKGRIRTRLLSSREAARLMGAPDFWLPDNYNQAYRAMGDGVVVPVARWLSHYLVAPLARIARQESVQSTAQPIHPLVDRVERRAELWSAEHGV